MSGETRGLTPALFLDRDGIINHDDGYVSRIEDFRFVDGIMQLGRCAQRLGFELIVVTNQSGLARGLYDVADVVALHTWMLSQFANEGVMIRAIYYSPYHPEGTVERYRRESSCRKPGPGMLKQAATEHGLDLARSVMVGDKTTDLRAAHAAGLPRAYWMCSREPFIEAPLLDGCEVVRVTSLSEVEQGLAQGITI